MKVKNRLTGFLITTKLQLTGCEAKLLILSESLMEMEKCSA